MSNDSQEKTTSRNVIEVITIANEYCLFIEEVAKYDRQYIFHYLQKILPLLYLKASLLPEISVSNPDANERFVTQENWQDIYNNLHNLIGKNDAFYHLVSESNNDNEIIKGSIAENLSDIYQDLKDFLLLYQKNSLAARENAVASCKNLYENNWGLKLLLVLQVLHKLVFFSKQNFNTLYNGFSAN